MKKQETNQPKSQNNIILIIILAFALIIMGILLFRLIPKSCTHFFCEKEIHEPTCSEKGFTVYTCQSCGYQFDADFIAPLNHAFEEKTVSPTCDKEGYVERTCAVCGDVERDDFTVPTGHSYIQSVTAPTCTDEGYTTYSCDTCGYSIISDYTAPKGHELEIKTVAPTCEEQGFSVYSCKRCDYTHVSDYTEPLGHDEKTTVINPTCDEQGYSFHKCSRCNYSYINNFTEPTNHSYEKTYVRPNIEQTGYTVYTCTVCGSEHIGDYVFYSDIFTGASGEGKGKSSAWGVDLSHHSEEVDFEALKSAGVDFVILRVGYNKSLDTRFEQYYKEAKAAGLDVGVYFFTLAENKEQALADAKRVSAWLDGKKLEYPVFYDIEAYGTYQPSTFSEEQIMEISLTFMQTMVEEGYYPGLYTNNNLLYSIYNSEKALCLYDVWYARYAAEGVDIDSYVDANIDEYSKTYSMWQYMGDVYGFAGAVTGACDVNYAFKDYPDIMKTYGFNGYQ